MFWLKVFFKNAPGFTNGPPILDRSLHWSSTQLNRLSNSDRLNLFRYRNRVQIGPRHGQSKSPVCLPKIGGSFRPLVAQFEPFIRHGDKLLG